MPTISCIQSLSPRRPLWLGRWLVVAACFVLGLAAGCSAPGAKVASIQKEKEELIATVQKERQANRNLSERAAALETRLDQSEKQLAVLSGNGTRWADNRPNSSPLPSYPHTARRLAWCCRNHSCSMVRLRRILHSPVPAQLTKKSSTPAASLAWMNSANALRKVIAPLSENAACGFPAANANVYPSPAQFWLIHASSY